MNFFREHRITISVITVVILLTGLYTWSVIRNNQKANLPPSDADLAFSIKEGENGYTDLNGNKVVVSDYIGTVLLVNSWASWSPTSAKELQALEKIATSYPNGQVIILAINRSEPARTAKQFLSFYKITSQVTLLLDPDDKFYKSIGGYTMPETVIYNEAGKVHSHFRGEIIESEVRQKIDEVLGDKV